MVYHLNAEQGAYGAVPALRGPHERSLGAGILSGWDGPGQRDMVDIQATPMVRAEQDEVCVPLIVLAHTIRS